MSESFDKEQEAARKRACQQCVTHRALAKTTRPHTFFGLFYLPGFLSSREMTRFHDTVATNYETICDGFMMFGAPAKLEEDYSRMVIECMRSGVYAYPPSLYHTNTYKHAVAADSLQRFPGTFEARNPERTQ